MVLKSSKMGPHLVLIFLERSFFDHYKAFCPRVLKARFRFRTHWYNTEICLKGAFHGILEEETAFSPLPIKISGHDQT